MMASEQNLENNVGQEIIEEDDKITFKSLVKYIQQLFLYIFIELSHHSHFDWMSQVII